jgi:hypothetical protein
MTQPTTSRQSRPLPLFPVSLFVFILGAAAICEVVYTFHFRIVGFFLGGLWGSFWEPILRITWIKDRERVKD